MAYEQSTDLEVVGTPVKGAFEAFAEETGRELKLEIEPGTFLLANSCAIVCSVQVGGGGRSPPRVTPRPP